MQFTRCMESHRICSDDLASGPEDMIGSSLAENCVALSRTCTPLPLLLCAASLGQHASHYTSELAMRAPAMPSLVWEEGRPSPQCSP